MDALAALPVAQHCVWCEQHPTRDAGAAQIRLFPQSMLCRKFTHLLQTSTMLLICVFATGVDEVDLDKCGERWEACKPFIAHVFAHASYPKAAALRELHRDFGVQSALFTCLCLWRARVEMQTCADQVRPPFDAEHIAL
jgi:hypothetical protein